MTCSANHVMWLAACFANRLFDFVNEKRIHRHRRLTQEDVLPYRQPTPFGDFFPLAN